ncbi:ribonuclease domain-containing protein [Pseudoxanthomonas sp. Root630]|uniref:ribonuclease domain-containing protein n=1 Tax=Pseudoxanthomonas sp. Root630 TaxID=1736574 RepID=UPI001F1C0D18|nr:ribonuclease domain-containing protein [Pseudoxanthomonas sp. Root630]
MRLPLLAFVALLLIGAGAWWWSQRDDAPDAPAVVATQEAGDPQRINETLSLPPVEDTRPGGLAGQVPTVEPEPARAATVPATDALPAFLPPEARATLTLIQQGGPFPHRQDGAVFQNREGRLPRQARGYYHEYTVDTPGLDHRGTRRIVTGGNPPSEYYYTDDHYDSFRRFEIGQGSVP